MADLMGKVGAIASEQGAAKVVGLKVRLGALSHISPECFREHFAHAALGTQAEGARLEIETSSDECDPCAQDVVLENITLEEAA